MLTRSIDVRRRPRYAPLAKDGQLRWLAFTPPAGMNSRDAHLPDACQAASTSLSRSAASPAPLSICARAASGAALNHVNESTADVARGRKVRPAATARAFATCVLA